MKYLPILLLFCSFNIHAQKQTIFRIDSLPTQGILLDKNWKWHAGDNPDWAKADFDDSAWESIDPTKDIYDLPQIPKNGQIGWFRLRLSVDSAINQQMVLMIQQSGASEIYLNGKLIHQFGNLSTNSREIKAFNPLEKPVSFPLQKDSLQVLAIRYALQPNVLYANHFGSQNKILSIVLISTEKAMDSYGKLSNFNNVWNSFSIGLNIILCILYFAFYLYYPKQKANLYFSIYCLFALMINTFSMYWQNMNQVDGLYWLKNLDLSVGVISSLFLLTAIYRLFEQKIDVFFAGLLLLGLVSILMAFGVYNWGWVNGLYLNIIGYLFAISQTGIPLAVAIYLGYDFALTNRLLQRKLAEVEELSAEKQQILSAQNETLEKQVKERTAELVASQNQLIQKEKLASLGELTAGIAHEIQNPLNFVNNFSEMSVELAQELKEEAEKPEIDKELIIDLANDLAQNQQKINHHGKRASSIVSGMLEHSRASTGERALTDINKLADEYLRLSYHGMRAKYKDFNSDYELIADEHLPLINIVPQDMGRVLLNLINNAFYAVHQRNNMVETGHALSLPTQTQYQPTVIISVQHINNQIVIAIKDNGTGMSEATKSKIFQPFFTTKPTGEGTGLGLSLAYDIITKGHGGTIEVESVAGEGTTFTVKLPIQPV